MRWLILLLFPAVAAAQVGMLVTGVVTYPATYTSGATLRYEYAYVEGGTPRPALVYGHGFSGGAGSLAIRRRYAEAGTFVTVPALTRVGEAGQPTQGPRDAG